MYIRTMLFKRNFIIIPFTLIILLSFAGCRRDSIFKRYETKVAEGKVYTDCEGNVSKGRVVYLYHYYFGCFGSGILSKDSTITDENGHYQFRYKVQKEAESTTSNWYSLTLANSTINIGNPDGNYDLYPNDTTMNALIHLKFHKRYTNHDTFYYQFEPTYKGYVEYPQHIGYLVGPFRDTALLLKNLIIGNSYSYDDGNSKPGFFKWGIGRDRLDDYYTGQDGSFDLTHHPCSKTDVFEYYADPIN